MADEPDILSDYDNDPQWVTYLQETLQYWGFWNGENDGSFSPQLEECVKSFQDAQGLVVDGWVGPRTWCVLNREGVVIDLDQFPKLKELASITSESAAEQHLAMIIGHDDPAAFSETDSQLA